MEKFTNEELIEMLTPELQASNELTDSQKRLLGLFMVYNELDETKNNGYFYRSNSDLMNDCEIKSKSTLITAIAKLKRMNLIERKVGSRTVGASEYKLNEETIENYQSNGSNDNCTNRTNGSNDNCTNNCTHCTNNCTNDKIVKMADRIRVLEEKVQFLLDKIGLMNCTNCTNGSNANCTTDTETEKDIEKEPIIINDIVYKDVLLSNNIKDDLKDSLSVVQSKEDNLINNLIKDDIMEENGFLEKDYFFNEGFYQELEKDLRNEVESKPRYDSENKETLNKTIDEILQRVQKLKLIKRNKINLFNEVREITFNRLKEPITYILREPLKKFFEKSLDTSTGEKDVVQEAESSLDIAC